ncbi:MAG TPA: hypothetical protein VE082_09275, partial [Desulfobaccales bacterium]|nr:hypothetical protein [Desulfobaccales bacterium]
MDAEAVARADFRMLSCRISKGGIERSLAGHSKGIVYATKVMGGFSEKKRAAQGVALESKLEFRFASKLRALPKAAAHPRSASPSSCL